MFGIGGGYRAGRYEMFHVEHSALHSYDKILSKHRVLRTF